MSSKFAALAANVTDAFHMPIINPLNDAVLRDNDGQEAYILLLSADSVPGRAVDRLQSTQVVRMLRSGRNAADANDLTEQQIEKLIVLTVGWHLVDLDGNPMNVEFSPANARELWSEPELAWLRRQAWVFVYDSGNFIKRSSKS